MPDNKVTIDNPKNAFKKINKVYSDINSLNDSGDESSSTSFEATAYVPRFWERVINISRLFLFLIVIGLLFWFTVGSDLLYGIQKRSFEKNGLTGFYEENKPDFQQFYGFVSPRDQKLTNLTFNRGDQIFDVRIEDQYMSKQPRPIMVLHVVNSPWRKNDYEQIINGELFMYRDKRERTIKKDWMYDFRVAQNQQVQSSILGYLDTNQVEFSAVLSSLKEIGQDFEIYPDSIVSTLNHGKFGKYHLLYHTKKIMEDQWNKIDEGVYFKRVPKVWNEE